VPVEILAHDLTLSRSLPPQAPEPAPGAAEVDECGKCNPCV